MCFFWVHRNLEKEVVRLAIIPLSLDPGSGGGRALSSIWSQGQPIPAMCMVTHNWSNLFIHLVAGIFADALREDYYKDITEKLLEPDGRARLQSAIDEKGLASSTYWVCAFSINQHALICNSFGPAPPQDTPEFEEWNTKRVDTVTGQQFPLCHCRERKIFNNEPALCEVNKFDAMMAYLSQNYTMFSHLVVADGDFKVFQRAWCIAEIVESDLSDIPQRIKIHSDSMLDLHYKSLSGIDVRDCKASRSEDREMILSNIINVDSFNTQLQWSIFGTRGSDCKLR